MKWKECVRFPCYEVSERGDVRRIKRGIRGGFVGKVMKPYRREDGYNMFILRNLNRSFHVKAHQLVAEAFVGPKPFPDAEVCHCDGSRHNDHFTNLRWDTRAANHADKVRHGTTARGERGPAAKLSSAQVAEIRSRYAIGGVSQQALADEFGVRQPLVSRIVAGKRRAYDGLPA